MKLLLRKIMKLFSSSFHCKSNSCRTLTPSLALSLVGVFFRLFPRIHVVVFFSVFPVHFVVFCSGTYWRHTREGLQPHIRSDQVYWGFTAGSSPFFLLSSLWSGAPSNSGLPILQATSVTVETEGLRIRLGWRTLRAWPSPRTAPCTSLTAQTSAWWTPRASSTR